MTPFSHVTHAYAYNMYSNSKDIEAIYKTILKLIM